MQTLITTEHAENLQNVAQALQANPDVNVVISALDEGSLGAVVLNFEGDLMHTFGAIKAIMKDPAANGRQQSVPMVVKKKP